MIRRLRATLTRRSRLTIEPCAELPPACSKSLQNPRQALERRISLAPFDAADVGAVKVSLVCQVFLRQARFLPERSKDPSKA
jgi:hypothetical protein